MEYINVVAKEVFFILTCLTAIAGIIYWILKTKLKEDFMKEYALKRDCSIRHKYVEDTFVNYRKDIASELKEIKELIFEVRKLVFDFISNKNR